VTQRLMRTNQPIDPLQHITGNGNKEWWQQGEEISIMDTTRWPYQASDKSLSGASASRTRGADYASACEASIPNEGDG